MGFWACGEVGNERPIEPGAPERRTFQTFFASRNHSAVGDDRPPILRHTGGRAFLLAILQRITNALGDCHQTGGPELNPLKYPFHVCHHSTRLYVEIVYAHN